MRPVAPFPILDLQFEAGLEGPLTLPPYPGGLLRGAFGAALRQLSCMTGFRRCDGCPLLATCPFPALFNPPPADLTAVGLGRTQLGVPPPFILLLPQEDPGQDGRLLFGMRLIGHAIDRMAYVIEAWRRALGRGLGRDRVRGQLHCVRRAEDGHVIWAGDAIMLPPPLHHPMVLPVPDFLIVTRTPMRMVAKGSPIAASALSPRMMVAAIVRRARLLAVHGGDEARAEVAAWPVGAWLDLADQVQHRPDLHWRDWYRWSSRQQRRMNLGGHVGQWLWRDVPDALAPLLALGEQIHVGKEASFGLGAYEIRAA